MCYITFVPKVPTPTFITKTTKDRIEMPPSDCSVKAIYAKATPKRTKAGKNRTIRNGKRATISCVEEGAIWI